DPGFKEAMMMTRQGSCLDPRPDALTVVDRLAGLSKVISPAVMEQVLLDTGRATCLQVVAPCHALGGVGHGRAHRSAHSSGVQTRAAYATGRQNALAQQSVRGATAPGGGAGPTRL